MSAVSAPAPQEESPASRLIFWLLGFFAFLNVYSMQSVLPQIMDDFHASALQAGATVGATVLAVALVSPFVGMLSDAIGRKALLVVALALIAVPTGLIALTHSLSGIVALRFFQGLAVPGVTVVLMAYIGEEFQGKGVTRMIGAYVAGSVFGGFCGRFITGHVGEWWGWRVAFVVLATITLAGVAVAWKGLPPSRRFRPHRDVAASFAILGRHLGNRRLVAACGVGFCVLCSLVGSFTYVNVLLARAPFHLSPGALANVFCVYLLGVVTTPLAAHLIHRHGYRGTLVRALALSLLGFLPTLLHWLPGVILGLALISTGIFIAQSTSISFIAVHVSEGRSLASGLYNMSYYAGGAAGAWGCGLAFEAAGWDGAVAVVAAVQGLAMLLAWFGWRERPLATSG